MPLKVKPHLAVFTALLAGLIFGLGLILGGMASPAKVWAFLNITALWDPSLAFVMGGAIAVGLIAFSIAKKRSRSYLDLPMHIPTSCHIDARLMVGSLIFGIGWGLAGICPAPALVLLGAGSMKGAIFLVAMLAGMGIFELFAKRYSANN